MKAAGGRGGRGAAAGCAQPDEGRRGRVLEAPRVSFAAAGARAVRVVGAGWLHGCARGRPAAAAASLVGRGIAAEPIGSGHDGDYRKGYCERELAYEYRPPF